MAERIGQCLVDSCSNQVVYARGLCRDCYLYASRLVGFGLSSWRAMELQGCCLLAKSPKYNAPKIDRAQWFAKSLGVNAEELSRRFTEKMAEKYRVAMEKTRKEKAEKIAERKAMLAGLED